jgi:outer membrane lipoprotein-sorting protein
MPAVLGSTVLLALLAGGLTLRVLGDTGDHDIRDILKKMDELYRSESSYSDVEMEIVTPNWQRALVMQSWTRGMDKTFIRILSPKKEKGMGTLRIGNEMWNYLPKTNKVMKIPPSMMMGSWMGSDFTNDDIVSEITYLDDYTYEWADTEDAQEGVLHIKCVPKEGVPVVWGHFVMAVREADYIPIWEKYYDEKNRLMRTLLFSDVRQFGKRTLPSTMEMIPENKEGHKTIVRYTSATFDEGVDDDVFSIRNLRSP